jgi:hypothetical protein
MARELVRDAGRAIAAKGVSAIKKHAKKAAKKHATKKHAKKAAKHAVNDGPREKPRKNVRSFDASLRRAFHHLQRASAVISLLDSESGSDLKVMLHEGTELYRQASKSDAGNAEAAAGLLRATEHLAMAGLYAARGIHPLNLEDPDMNDIEELGWSIGHRLAEVDPKTEYGRRLHAMVFELVKRAEGSEHDPHLAWELVNGADGICVALEFGID